MSDTIPTTMLRARAVLIEGESPGRAVTAKYLRLAADEIDSLRAKLAECEKKLTKAYAEGLEYSCRAVSAEAELKAARAVVEAARAARDSGYDQDGFCDTPGRIKAMRKLWTEIAAYDAATKAGESLSH